MKLTMRASTGAAIGVVSELVDMNAPLGGGVTALDVVGNGRWGGFGALLKSNSSRHGGITPEDCDCNRRKNRTLATCIPRNVGSGERKQPWTRSKMEGGLHFLGTKCKRKIPNGGKEQMREMRGSARECDWCFSSFIAIKVPKNVLKIAQKVKKSHTLLPG